MHFISDHVFSSFEKKLYSLLMCFIGFIMPLHKGYSEVHSDVTFHVVKGQEVSTYLGDVDVLRRSIYLKPPYSYDIDGSGDKDWDDLDSFKNNDAIFVLASHNNKIVGIATGLPLQFYAESWRPYFKKFFNDDLSGLYYNSDLLVSKDFDQHAISIQLLEILTREVFSTQKYRSVVAYSVVRKDGDPFKEDAETFVNRIALQQQGFHLKGLVENVAWPTSLGDWMHTCDVWVKKE